MIGGALFYPGHPHGEKKLRGEKLSIFTFLGIWNISVMMNLELGMNFSGDILGVVWF